MKKLIASFQRLLSSQRWRQQLSDPIFIIGCGRSGTTLLFELLGKHPDVVATTGHPDGEDHVGWIEHGGALIAGLATPAGDTGHVGYPYCLHMTAADVEPETAKCMQRYYRDEVLQGRKKRVLNKCPHLSNKLDYVLEIFPHAKFVHIIRDVFPVVASWAKIMESVPELELYWPEEEKFPCFWVFDAPRGRKQLFAQRDRFFPGGGERILADYWAVVNRNIPVQMADQAQQLITLRYEDLCDDPVRALRRLTDFCELSPFDEIPDQVAKDRNQKYTDELSSAQIDRITSQTDETRRLFGYE